MKLPTKILFICKERVNTYGISTGLLQSSKFIADYLTTVGYNAKVAVCPDANSIDKEVYNFRPDKIIIHAIWVTPEKLQELATKYSQISWVVMIHSKLPFLANEGIAFKWLHQYCHLPNKNVQIGANNIEAVNELQYALKREIIYLPNIYSEQTNIKKEHIHQKKVLHVGCFGAIRPLKNVLMQAVAAIRYGDEKEKKIIFHINAGRVEQSGEQVLKNIRALFDHNPKHELVEHGWLTHLEFLKLVGRMDVGMQVSLSETFNITAADFVYMDIPIVVSPEIEWMPKWGQADPTKIDDIAIKIGEVLQFQRDGFFFCDYAERALRKYNKKAQNIWKEYLNK